MLCRRRRTRDATCLPPKPGWASVDDEKSARMAQHRRVDKPCLDSVVHRPDPGCWVAGWTIRPIDDLFRRIGGETLLKYLGQAELSPC